MTEETYAGDVSPSEAWQVLKDDSGSVLVDCRTDAEWRYVGLPDLSGLDKDVVRIAWQVFPEMRVNAGFADELAAAGVTRGSTVLFLCRSGVRSRDAAVAMTEVGFSRCFNVSDGFEGPHDREKHRGRIAGWKASGLPWTQG